MNAVPAAEFRLGTIKVRGLLEPGDDPAGIQRCIDNQVAPALTVPEGSTITFDCPGMPLPPEASIEHLAVIDPERPHAVVGPVYVEGAQVGDTLIVDIIDVALAQNYGHTLFLPGHGLLPDDFSAPYIHNWALPLPRQGNTPRFHRAERAATSTCAIWFPARVSISRLRFRGRSSTAEMDTRLRATARCA